MAAIRCTQKLLAEMGLSPANLAEINSNCSETALAEWYANLAVIKRQKIVVFINPATLFVTLALGIRRNDLHNLPAVFLESLTATLSIEGIEPTVIQTLAAHFETTQITKTSDRRTLGYLNDVIHQFTWQIERNPNPTQEEIASIRRRLNRTPWAKAQFICAIEAMEPVLQNNFGWNGQFS